MCTNSVPRHAEPEVTECLLLKKQHSRRLRGENSYYSMINLQWSLILLGNYYSIM